MKKIRWGLLGAGIILNRWMQGALQAEGMEIRAIASRTPDSARKMAEKWKIDTVLTYEEMLERQLRLADETKADILYCSYRMIDENGKCLWRNFEVPKHTDFNHMLSSSVISCSTVILSEKITNRYRFPENCYHEDLAFWLLLLRNGYIARGNPHVLAAYRLRKNSRASNKLHVAMERWHLYRDILHLSLIKSAKSFFIYAVLGCHKYTKRLRKAE